MGVGACFAGYSYITDSRTSLAKLTDAMADALSRVVLKVNDVKINGSVPLDTGGATVRLGTKGASVALDSAATNEKRLVPPISPESQTKVVTDYTLFYSVSFGNGSVVTGWHYPESNPAGPDTQYCYYSTKSAGGASNRFDIARDGQPLPPPQRLPVDVSQAFTYCTRFGSATAPGKET